jgi:hypothetical protein
VDKIATLAWLDFTRLARDRTQLAVMLVLPLMLTFLFGTMMGGGERKVSVAISDPDGTTYSKEVVAGLPERSYNLRRVGEEVARQMASSGEVAAAVIVPKGFGDDVIAGIDTKVVVVKDPRSTAAIAIVQAVQGRIRRIAANAQTVRIVRAAYRDAGRSTGVPAAGPTSVDIYAYADRLWSPSPPLAVREEAVQAAKVRAGSSSTRWASRSCSCCSWGWGPPEASSRTAKRARSRVCS